MRSIEKKTKQRKTANKLQTI